jgi:hypothetical protein
VGTAYDVVFATLGGDGKTVFIAFGATHGEVTIPTTACWFPQVASIPGALPLATVEKALSAGSEAACEKVLTDHDAAWGTMQGGPACTGTGQGTGAGGSAGAPDASAPGTVGAPDARDASAPGASVDAGVQAKSSDHDGGCALSTHAAGHPVIGIALSAAWLLHGVRRAQRRRQGR